MAFKPISAPDNILLDDGVTQKYVVFPDSVLENDDAKNNEVVFVTKKYDAGKKMLYCFHRGSKKSITREYQIYRYEIVGDCLYGIITERRRYRFWVKLNDQLEIVWKQPITNHLGKLFDRGSPQPFNDSIIVHSDIDLSIPDGEEGIDGVEARYKENGEIKWKAGLVDTVYSIQLVGDRVYIAHSQEIVVLNAETGAILLRQQTDFNPEGFTKVRCIDDYIFFQSTRDLHFKLFSKNDLTHIVDIPFPDAFAAHERHGPEKIGDKIYWSLVAADGELFDAKHALMIIDPEELKAGPPINIDLEQKPSVQVNCLQADDGEDYYQVVIEADRLDDALRFSEIEVKTVAATYGRQIYDSRRRNPNFNGEIVLQIKKETLDAVDDDKLQILETRLKKQLDRFYIAGTKNEPVTCRCEWV